MTDDNPAIGQDLGAGDTSAFADAADPGQPAKGDSAAAGAADQLPADQDSSAASGTGADTPAELKDTPFKNVGEVVEAYKKLQRVLSKKDQDYQSIQAQVRALLPALSAQLKPAQQAAAKKLDPDVFLRQFLGDPEGMLLSLINGNLTSVLDQHIAPLRSDLESGKQERTLDQFISKYGGELTAAQQERYLEILDEEQWIHSRPNGLELAYKLLVSEDPEGFAKAKAAKATAVSRELNDAKVAAGIGGKRTALDKAAEGQGDEFDEVLQTFETASKPYKKK